MTTAPELSTYGTERTINAVDDLGWDDTGEQPVEQPPEETGVTIEVPPGEYVVDDRWDFHDLDDWHLKGTGDEPDDVRFTVPQGDNRVMFNIRSGDGFALSNFVLDLRDDWETSTGMNVLGANFQLNSVQYRGWRPSEKQGTTTGVNAYVMDPDGEGYVVDFYGDERTALEDYPENSILLGSYAESKGTLYILDSEFENSGEHGVYASRTEGDVRIERCRFANNQNTHCRIAGEGSYAKDCLFVWDDTANVDGEFQSQTGLTLEAGFRGYSGGLVEDCWFVCEESAPNSGCLKVDGSQGAVTVRDCHILVDEGGDVPAVTVEAPGDSHMIREGDANDGMPYKPWGVTFENVSVTHRSGTYNRDNHDAAVAIDGREATTFTDVNVESTGDLDAIRLDGDTYSLSSELCVATETTERFIGSASRSGESKVGTDADCFVPPKDLPHDPEGSTGEDGGSDDSTSDGSTSGDESSDGSTGDESSSPGALTEEQRAEVKNIARDQALANRHSQSTVQNWARAVVKSDTFDEGELRDIIRDEQRSLRERFLNYISKNGGK